MLDNIEEMVSRSAEYTESGVKELVKAKDYKQAYKLMLDQGDDLYLLRMVVQTGPVVKKIDKNSVRSVL